MTQNAVQRKAQTVLRGLGMTAFMSQLPASQDDVARSGIPAEYQGEVTKHLRALQRLFATGAREEARADMRRWVAESASSWGAEINFRLHDANIREESAALVAQIGRL